MSVSHVSPSLHFHRRTSSRPRTKLERQHRTNLVLAAMALVLLAALVLGIVGLVTTVEPSNVGPTADYGTDGSGFTTLPHLAILWLWLTLMDVAAILGFGIGYAAKHQQ